MAEKRRLFSTGSDGSGKAGYGSIGYQPLGQDEDEDEVANVRFVYRKSDCIVVSVLLLLVTVAVLTTLLLGIPSIRRKHTAVEVVNTTSPLLTASRGLASGIQQVAPLAHPVYPSVSARGKFSSAGVSTNCPECSAIAADILRRNGSAMDAAIAATFCLSVVDPHHTGLGGGFLMTYYDRSSGAAKVLDARETAPAASTWDMFAGDPQAASIGGLSVAVPGLVRGLWKAHRMHGRLDWPALIAPSIPLCEDGFVIRHSLAEALQYERQLILKDPAMRSVFADAGGRDVLSAGQLVKQPALADTLRLLAAKGGDEFYEGGVAENISRDVRASGGVLDMSDLRGYSALVREPAVKRTSSGQSVYSAPAPGSGELVAFFLNVMEGYGLTGQSLDSGDERAVLAYHRMAEAMKHTYAKRTAMADPDFEDIREISANLTSEEYAAAIRTLIRDDVTYPPSYYRPEIPAPPEDHGTSHASIVGPEGDAVAITSTLNQKFGSRLMSASTGVILNDEMDDFSSPNVTNFFDVVPSPANRVAPGKRPLSSMCPTIVVDGEGRVTMATGASGGTRITSSTAYVILRHLYFGESVLMATDAPRFHHQLLPDEIEVEYGLPGVVVDGLRDIGHTVTMIERSATAVNTVSRDHSGRLDAVADRRVDARIDGF